MHIFLSTVFRFFKRRAELKNLNGDFSQRSVLKKYKIKFLDSLINDAAFGAIISYSIFCTINQNSMGLIITILPVYYALMHYKNSLFQNIYGEEPDSVVLKDIKIISSILIWLSLYIFLK